VTRAKSDTTLSAQQSLMMKRILKAITPLSRQRSSKSLLLMIDTYLENQGGPPTIVGRMHQQEMGRLLKSWGDRGPTIAASAKAW